METSILKILYKYRNNNQRFNDSYHKLAKNGRKVERFHNLVYLGEDATSKGYINLHTHVIVVINNDGYIDTLIYLYDRKLKFFDSDYLEDKSRNILEMYYKADRMDFINCLYKNGAISYCLYQKLLYRFVK